MRIPFSLPAVLAGILLLAACGSERAGPTGEGPTRSGCGAPSADRAATSGGPALPGGPADRERDGVKIIGIDGHAQGCAPDSAGFTVTNSGTEPLTYTVTFTFVSAAGEALANPRQTVPAVAPGRTVKGTVTMGGLPPSAPAAAGVRIAVVRSVPTDEAPGPAGSCPPSGIRVASDAGDAAMGLRVVGLTLVNCSTHPYRLEGYPRLQLLDEDREPVTGVKVLRGSGGISTGTGFDDPPRPVTLAPGESARSGILWRNTVTDGTPVNAPYVRVRATADAAPVMVTPELDIGTTGKVGVSPWKKDGPAATGR